MKILLTNLEGNVYPVEVSPDLEIVNLKALCEQEMNINSNQISLSHNGRPLNEDHKTLEAYSIVDNDIIVVQQLIANNLPYIDFGSISVPQTSRNNNSLENLRSMALSNPVQFDLLRQRFPELADAIQKNDIARMTQLMNQLSSNNNFNLASQLSNEFDLENQRKIAEAIRLQNIQQNMEHALEYMPEAFGNVVMLYIDCQVNGHHVKAFVDSGAQMTIMSSACAERCGIMRLVDTRWAGIAKGVGTQKIVGRVHLAQIQIENSFLTTSFSILENQPMDMLLGLDLLKRHQCIIDLERNLLVIKSANVETKFLPESELPSFARLNSNEDQVVIKEENKPGSSKISSNYSENVITNLTKLGFSRNEVIEALDSSNGNEGMAKIKLLAKSLKAPLK